jgi:hypothetical protein
MCGRVEWCEDVAREEREAEREVGAWEDGEGLYEYVGDSLIAGEVRVELVAATPLSVEAAQDAGFNRTRVDSFQIELIINFSGRRDSISIPRVIGNVVVTCSSCDVYIREGEGARTYSLRRARLA